MNAFSHEQIDAIFSAWANDESPGCAVGIYSEGGILYKRGYGSANLEHGISITSSTVFHVASLSKQFTATAIALLARSGRISLDDDIRRYIPEISSAPPITFRHIIHHTSGLRDQWDLLRLSGWRYADLKTTDDILRLAARQTDLNFQTGTRFQYINTGYTLMGIAVERVTGLSLGEYSEENVFKPLGMHDTFFQEDHQRIIKNRAQAYSRDSDGELHIDVPSYETVGPTGLFSTIEDFARWERNLLSPMIGDEEFVRQLHTGGALADGKPISYGFGLINGQHRGLEIAEHAGGDAGYRAHFLRFPGEQFAVAIFSNFSEMKPGQLARKVADICLAGRFPTEQADDTKAATWGGRERGNYASPAQDNESKCGSYRDALSGMTCRIEDRGGRLFLVSAEGGEYELTQAGDERFRFLEVDAECLFKPSTDDQPSRMIVSYAGEETGDCERIGDQQEEDSVRQLADYVAAYQSDELDCRYAIELSDDGLILRRAKFGTCALVPLRRDEFSCQNEGLHLRFVRDEGGQVNEFVLSAERVWNVRFTRL
ncbi:MAG: serine hydrolase domain-containing protein [Pyrinomonadaceae bacterium]